jgi:hypothetical protein
MLISVPAINPRSSPPGRAMENEKPNEDLALELFFGTQKHKHEKNNKPGKSSVQLRGMEGCI